MNQEEDFQFVVSREDYRKYRQYQTKFNDILSQKSKIQQSFIQQNLLNQENIQKLSQQLKSYQLLIKQYSQFQIQQIDQILQSLTDYCAIKKDSSITNNLLNEIQTQSRRISQLSQLQFKQLTSLNSYVTILVKNLITDSLDLNQKIKDYAEQISNEMEQKQDLYVKVRQLNEKLLSITQEKQLFIKNHQKLFVDNQFLEQKYDDIKKQLMEMQLNYENMKKKYQNDIKTITLEKQISKTKIHDLQKQIQKISQKNQKTQKDKQLIKSSLDSCNSQIEQLKKSLYQSSSKLAAKQKQIQSLNERYCQQILELERTQKLIIIYQQEKQTQQQSLKGLREENSMLKKLNQTEKKKSSQDNQTLRREFNFLKEELKTVYNLMKQNIKEKQALTEKVKNQQLQYNNQRQKHLSQTDQLHQQINQLKDQLSVNAKGILTQEEKIYQLNSLKQSLLDENQKLTHDIKELNQTLHQSSTSQNNTIENLASEVKRLNKQKQLFSNCKQSMNIEFQHLKNQNKIMFDDVNSLKEYVQLLERNLQTLSEEKIALKNQVLLFKEQAECCKKQTLDHLIIIEKLEKQLHTTKKNLNQVSNANPSSIVKRNSLSKGQKSYYVKEMILEYGNQMKKNLLEIGALSHEEIKELIASELRELGKFVKKLETHYD